MLRLYILIEKNKIKFKIYQKKGIIMRILKKWRLSNRLAFSYGFLFLITFASINFVIFRTIYTFTTNQMEKHIKIIKVKVENELKEMAELNKSEKENKKMAYKMAKNIFQKGFNIFIRIYDEDKLVLDTVEKNIPFFDHKIKLDTSVFKKVGNDFYSIVNMKLILKEKTMYIQFIMDIKTEFEFIKLLKRNMIVGELIGILISILVGKYLSKKVLEPVKEITENAKYITINNLSKRVYMSNTHDEMYELGKVINDMIERLENSFKNQNKFVSDASHELRTPLAVMQGYLDILDSWGKDEKDILDESVVALREEVKGMKNLVEKLLFLAKGQSGKIKLNKEKIMLNKLVKKVARDTEIIVPDYEIVDKINDEVEIEIDPNLIQQCMRGIIENSIKYNEENKRIEINLEKKENTVEISIKDNGIGMNEIELDKVFDRFYRVDESRTKDTGGTGLGLSIVKTIMDLHGGEIKIESQVKKGTKITMILPMG